MTALIPNPHARRALVASLAATILAGATCIVAHWLARGDAMRATIAGAAFVGAMCAVHVAGYHLYRRQPIAWPPVYRAALRDSIVVQAITFVLGSTILLSGIDKMIISLFFGYWAGIGMIVCRRPQSPKPSDLAFIRYGSFGLLAFMLALLNGLAALL